MADDIVVIDSNEEEVAVIDEGRTVVSEENAQIAEEAAEQARQWAVIAEEQANIATDAVATIVPLADDIQTIADNITDINAVANNESNINTVAGIASDIPSLASISSEISAVGSNISDVSTVATNINSVNRTSNAIASINTDANNMPSIVATAYNIANVNTVANNINNVNTVAGISSDVTTVSGISSDIATVASNTSNIQTVINNLTDIQNAEENAQLAKDWANKTSGTVDGSEYSSKYYAQIASQHADGLKVGQIITSILPLTESGVHLLDGALIQGGGVYQAFVTYVAGLVSSYPNLFTTEATWQSTVASKGVCGKFVYDSVNNTVRLPKITGFIEGTIDSNALGELVEAGLPNISGNVVFHHGNTYGTIAEAYGAFTPDMQVPNYSLGTGQSSIAYASFNFSAGDSNSIYGNSSTVQPQAIKVYYYIVVAASVKTDIEVDIDNIVTDLNAKADDDTVVHKTGDETVYGYKTFNGGLSTLYSDISSSNISGSVISSSNFTGNVTLSKQGGVGGGIIYFDKPDNTSLTGNAFIDIYGNLMRFIGKNSSNNYTTPLYLDLETGIAVANPSDVQNSVVTTTSISKGASGYVKLGNGIIIQWGTTSSSSGAKTVTFATAFSSTNYSITAIQTSGEQNTSDVYVLNKNTTYCQLSEYAQKTMAYDWIAIGY